MREGETTRKTKETMITVRMELEGSGLCTIETGIPFFDHMLQAMGRHGMVDLAVHAAGDLAVDTHHTIEDVGIVIGDTIRKAIGEGRGIRRFGHAIVPMDESLATVAIDISGRGYLAYGVLFGNRKVGDIDADIIEHFFYSLCIHAGITAHISAQGRNDHHKCEAVFKAFGIALRDATGMTGPADTIPSTKGTL